MNLFTYDNLFLFVLEVNNSKTKKIESLYHRKIGKDFYNGHTDFLVMIIVFILLSNCYRNHHPTKLKLIGQLNLIVPVGRNDLKRKKLHF